MNGSLLLQATVNWTRGVNSSVSMAHDLQLFQSPVNQYMSVEAEWPIMVVSLL